MTMPVLCVIGERSQPPSDKLGGEIFIASRVHCMFAIYYIYGVRVA